MKEENKVCNHNFEYSHQETELLGYGGANFKLVDVIICTVCGEIRRSDKK